MNNRIENLRSVIGEHVAGPVGPTLFATLVCDGCGATASALDANGMGQFPAGWKVGAAGPPDLCPVCAPRA
jgi:hypothetical protein